MRLREDTWLWMLRTMLEKVGTKYTLCFGREFACYVDDRKQIVLDVYTDKKYLEYAHVERRLLKEGFYYKRMSMMKYFFLHELAHALSEEETVPHGKRFRKELVTLMEEFSPARARRH